MSSIFSPILTDAGRAAAIAAFNAETSVQITSIHLGTGAYNTRDGGGDPVPAQAARTALSDDRLTIEVAVGTVVDDTLRMSFNVGPVDPAFTAREIGIFLDDGTLFAVASSATDVFASLDASSDIFIEFVLSLEELPAGSVTVVFTLDETIATMQERLGRLEGKIRHTIESTEADYDDADATQLTAAINDIVDAAISTFASSELITRGMLPLSAAPAAPVHGWYFADGVGWDPFKIGTGKPYPVYFDGAAFRLPSPPRSRSSLQTTDDTEATIATIALTAGQAALVRADIIAFEPATGEIRRWQLEAAGYHTDGAAFAYPPTGLEISDSGLSSAEWAINFDTNGGNALLIKVKGRAASTIKWTADLDIRRPS